MPTVLGIFTGTVQTGTHVSVLSLLARLVVSLSVVLFVVWGLAQFVRRRGLPGVRSAGARGRKPSQIDVIGRQSLGKGQTLVTVRTEDRVLLLGVTARSITMLSELDRAGDGVTPEFGNAVPEATALPPVPLSLLPAAAGAAGGATASGSWADRVERLRSLTVRR